MANTNHPAVPPPFWICFSHHRLVGQTMAASLPLLSYLFSCFMYLILLKTFVHFFFFYFRNFYFYLLFLLTVMTVRNMLFIILLFARHATCISAMEPTGSKEASLSTSSDHNKEEPISRNAFRGSKCNDY